MDTENTLLQISQNEQNLGTCDSDTAANIINNEDVCTPVTYFMSSPEERNPDGSIRVARMRQIVESGAYDGAAQTLADARLYSFYKPLEAALKDKEDLYKKIDFDQSNFFYRTYKDVGRNWYSLQRNEYKYLLAKAEQEGNEYDASEYRLQIADLDKQIANYVIPEDDYANSTANLIASMGRNAPELIAITAAAGTAAYFGAPPLAVELLSSVAQGVVVYQDTRKLEAGELISELEISHPEMSADDRLNMAEAYGHIAALIEASGAFFGIAKLGRSAVIKTASKKALKKAMSDTAKKAIVKELAKKGVLDKIKDPKFLAFLGRTVWEHVKAAAGEGGQEVTQQLIEDAFIRGIEEHSSTSLIDNSIELLKDASEQSKLGNIFLHTGGASLALSGMGAGAASGTKVLFAKSVKGMNIDQISQRIIDNKAKSVAYQKSPKAYSENTQKIVDAGNAPEKISIDSSAWLSVLNKAEEKGETTILQKLNELGLTKDVLEDSIKATGQMEIDFTKFDDVVLDPNDSSLFQMVKGKYTADPTALTLSELISASQNIDGVAEEMRMAESDVSSLYNRLLPGLSKNKNFTPEMAQRNAMVAQLLANRYSTFEGDNRPSSQLSVELLNVKESMLDKAKNVVATVKEKIVSKKRAVKTKKEKPVSLLQFLINHGGIKDEHGELKVFDAVKQRPGLVNNKRGMTLDHAREIAEEAGYFGVVAKNEHGTTSVSDLLDKIDMELRGKKVYREEDISYSSEERDYEGEKENYLDSYLFERGYSDEQLQRLSLEEKESIYNGMQVPEEEINERELSEEEIKKLHENESESDDDIPFFQKTTDKHIAGMFSREMEKNIIRLTEAANPTTFLHEFNHLFMTEMVDSFNSGKMTQYWKEQVEKVADFVGAKIVKGKLQLTEAQYEKLANAFTTYLKEGKAPVASLKDVFNRMREWFIDVYRKLRMSNVRLNKSIRSAFDAMLVSQEELDNAIIDKKLKAIGRRSWVSESDYQQYLSDLSELSRVTTNQHIEAIDKQTKIATEEKNKQMLDEFRLEAAAELEQQREYQLQTRVKNEKIHAGDIPSTLQINDKESFLDPVGVPVQQFITDFPDVVSNVADVVDLLNNLEPLQEAADRIGQERFDTWLQENYQELADTNMKIAAANEKMLKVRVREYMMLTKIPMERFNQVYTELKNVGAREVAKMSLRELTNIERLLELETKIVTKERMAQNDTELSNALWHQAILNYIIMRSKEIRVEVQKFNRHFDKYNYTPTKTQLKRIDALDFDMITGILHNFGFTRKETRMKDLSIPARIEQWINRNTQTSFSSAEEIRDYIPFLGKETQTKFDKNTYADFGRLDTLIRQIEAISSSSFIMKEQGEEILIQDIADESVKHMQEKGIKPDTREWMTTTITMMETYLKGILPEKVFGKYVLPFVDSFSKRTQRVLQLQETIYGALKDIMKRRNEIVQVKLNDGSMLNMTYEEMQVAVLNIDNMETWIASTNEQKNKNLNTEDFKSIIEQAPQEMLDAAQTIWDAMDSQKMEFRDSVYKTNGYLMKFVEPRQLELSDGRVIQSGYFPSKKMPTKRADFEKVVMAFNNGDAYSNAISPYAKDKNYIAHRELDLTLNSLRSWIYHISTVIEVAPHYQALNNIINNKTFSSFVGDGVTKALNSWMQYPIAGDQVNKFLATIDKVSSVAILGFNPMKFIVQSLGWIPVMKEVGVQWLMPQLVKRSLNTKQIMQKSSYMKTRIENPINIVGNVSESNMLIRTGKTIQDKIFNVAMIFAAKGDQFSSTAVWNAIYEKSLAEGKSEAEAILAADSMVRTSQGGSDAVSRPPILQGNLRFFTKFASYFIAMNSKINSQLIGQQRLDAVATLMLAGILSPTIEAIIRAMVDWEMPTDDDKKKWKKRGILSFEDLVYYHMKQQISSTLGMIGMPAFGIGGRVSAALSTGQYWDSPIPTLEYLHTLEKTAVFPILAINADDEKAKKRYWRNFKKSGLKALTVPKKFVNMIVE